MVMGKKLVSEFSTKTGEARKRKKGHTSPSTPRSGLTNHHDSVFGILFAPAAHVRDCVGKIVTECCHQFSLPLFFSDSKPG